ncbi:hypothetical protein FQN49_008253 [Arthroderma sp. PD_2]|nr:hypothetical protein FQN49_008253 [Arthroderma sp. PD_2]
MFPEGEPREDGIRLEEYPGEEIRETRKENGIETHDNASIFDEDEAEQDRLLSSLNQEGDEERLSSIGPSSSESAHDSFAKDPFKPFSTSDSPSAGEERILTFRALLVGVLCGALVNASNIYLGLRAGWTASANIFGSIIGFAVLKSWSSHFAPSSLLGGFFGPQENNIVQTAATAAGGLSSVFVSAFPAMYQLNLLDTPWRDFLWITILTAAVRKFFIFQVARELNLVFPSSSATAITISSMHLASGGSQLARRKMVALGFAFVFALMLRVISQYAPGVLTGTFLLAWRSREIYLPRISMGHSWANYYKPWACVWDASIGRYPRYWLLWPGVACMIAVGFTELACQWRVFWLTGLEIFKASRKIASRLRSKEHEYTHISEASQEAKSDGTTPGDIKQWMWLPGLIAVLVLTCVVSKLQYGIPIPASLLSLFLAFIFSFIAVQATGATDITPLTAISKASQLVLGATTRGPGWSLERSQQVNLLGGALSSIGANQACDLTGDFRVGFLLSTPPRTQYAAQAIGTFFAVFLAPAVFSVFASAYPCILSTDDEFHSKGNTTVPCPFTAPAASAWRAAAVAVTDPDFPVPKSSVQFAIAMAIIGSILVLVRHNVWTDKWLWMRAYHPNMMTVAMAFLIPTTQYGTAMLTGTVIAMIWKRRNNASFEAYGYAIAAGFMAGEGIGGVVNAALTIMGIDGERLGTNIGCPAGKC